MRFTPSDMADHINLNKIFQRPSSSLEERALSRNQKRASFCENFCIGSIFDFFNRIGPQQTPRFLVLLHDGSMRAVPSTSSIFCASWVKCTVTVKPIDPSIFRGGLP